MGTESGEARLNLRLEAKYTALPLLLLRWRASGDEGTVSIKAE